MRNVSTVDTLLRAKNALPIFRVLSTVHTLA